MREKKKHAISYVSLTDILLSSMWYGHPVKLIFTEPNCLQSVSCVYKIIWAGAHTHNRLVGIVLNINKKMDLFCQKLQLSCAESYMTLMNVLQMKFSKGNHYKFDSDVLQTILCYKLSLIIIRIYSIFK